MSKESFILKQFGLGNGVLNTPNFPRLTAPEESEAVAYTYLGNPVFSNIEFETGLTLNTVLMEVTGQNTIVKTAVNGRIGTVKELISRGDYTVSIKGGLFSESPKLRPDEQFRQLLDVCKEQVSVGVVSEFLQRFDIYDLVVESYRFPQKEGTINVQFFELDCVSDEPVELRITNE